MKLFLLSGFLKILTLTQRIWPFGIRLFAWKLYFLIRFIIRYRKSVITSNLTACFNGQTDKEQIHSWCNAYYLVLRRYILEALYIATMPPSSLINRIKVKDQDQWQSFFDQNPNTIIMASHYGNWEMNIVMLPSLLNRRVVAFYKPISDKAVGTWMHGIRSAHGLELHPIEQTLRVMNQLKNENILYIFIGDQSPVNLNGVHWNNFLGRRTPWYTGAEKLAIRLGYPVLYLHQVAEDHNPLYYTIWFERITDNPVKEATGKITEKYTRILESEINQNPIYWLWSHKRWKRVVSD